LKQSAARLVSGAAAFFLLATFSARGSSTLENADWRIRKLRTRKLSVRVYDHKGRPVPGLKVRAEMQKHQFLFGCNLLNFNRFPTQAENQAYLEAFTGVFNYGTVPFYLRFYEPSRGVNNRDAILKIVAWAKENRITLKGHPLVWHDPIGSPSWFPSNPEELEPVLKDEVVELVSEFCPGIQYWDVVNEPTSAWKYSSPVALWENELGPLAATQKVLSWVRSQGEEAVFLVNDFNLFPDKVISRIVNRPEQAARFIRDPVKHYPVSYFLFLARLKSQGPAPDAIGLQSHMHEANWLIADVWKTAERFGRLGLPVHFTEVTVLSGAHRKPSRIDWTDPAKNQPWPSTPQGEREQAEYVEQFYKVLFSNSHVQAITWWDLSDKEAWLGAPAGLLRSDFSPKPAYERIRHLVREEWWTKLEGKTNADGEFSFRGFCGDYLLEVEGAEPAFFSIDCLKPDGQILEMKVQP